MAADEATALSVTAEPNRSDSPDSSTALAASPPPHPFPWARALILAWCQFTSAFSFVVLFPFVPIMIVDMGLVPDARTPGFYSGLLISASSLGQILTAFAWGSFSDNHGRKAVIYIGLAGISAAMLIFGLSSSGGTSRYSSSSGSAPDSSSGTGNYGSFGVACAARFLCGLCDSVESLTKTLLGDTFDEQHQARGMALLGSTWGLAVIVGPSIGGLLSQPALKYPTVFDSAGLFGVYPYLLPCCFPAAMAIVAALLLPLVPESGVVHAAQATTKVCTAAETKNQPPDNNERMAEQQTLLARQAPPTASCSSGHASGDEGRQHGLEGRWYFLKEQTVVQVIAVAAIVDCFMISDDDVMPLWGAAPREAGGLGLSTNEIGGLLCIMGAFILLFLRYFETINEKVGTLQACQVSLLVFIFAAVATPLATDFESDGAMWAWLCSVCAAKAVAMEFAINAVSLLVNNATPREHRGAMNGAAETACGIGKMIAPAMSSPLFAWSLTNELGWPFNHHLAFITNATMAVLAICITTKMRPSISKPPTT